MFLILFFKKSSFVGNIIAQSQTGTGKTAAFSLAIISRIDPSIQSPQALILAPTFELVIQIISVIEIMAQFLPYIKVADAVRGQKRQAEIISLVVNFYLSRLLLVQQVLLKIGVLNSVL
jgi:superfamily II DNA/RNA helicase